MDITTEGFGYSEDKFASDFLTLADSGAGVIHVRATEVVRAVSCLRKTILVDSGRYFEWDIVNGTREFDITNYVDESIPGDEELDLNTAFQAPLGAIRDGALSTETRTIYYVFVNPHPLMESNPHLAQLLLTYTEFLPVHQICVVLVTPDAPLPEGTNNSSILSLHFRTPNRKELQDSLDKLTSSVLDEYVQDSFTEEEKRLICNTGAGLTRLQFETCLALASVRGSEDDASPVDVVIKEIRAGKVEIVNSSDVLELYDTCDIDNVGGMDVLKEWISKRKTCFSDEARAFGIEPPKGAVLVGIPGTGKSLVGKAVASTFGVPLIRLDFGKVFSSYVGASESRMRGALSMIESMAPVVVLCVTGDTKLRLADGSTIRAEEAYAKTEAGKTLHLAGYDPDTQTHIALSASTVTRSVAKSLIRVTMDDGRQITVTEDHRFLGIRNGELQWLQANELDESDDLLLE